MFLSVLNVLWLMGVAAGLGIFGLFPATFALFKLFGQQELFETQSPIKPIFKAFWLHYRACFLKANGIGLVYAAVLFSIGIDKNIVQLYEPWGSFLLVPLNLLSIYVLLTLAFLIPIDIHTEGSTREKMKLALLAPVLMPKASALIVLVGIGSVILADVFAAGIFLFYVSLAILLLNKICLKSMYQKSVIVERALA